MDLVQKGWFITLEQTHQHEFKAICLPMSYFSEIFDSSIILQSQETEN